MALRWASVRPATGAPVVDGFPVVVLVAEPLQVAQVVVERVVDVVAVGAGRYAAIPAVLLGAAR